MNTLEFDDLYEVFDYRLIGNLIKIRHPGMLLINKNNESSQIFDQGGINFYILLNVEFSKESHTRECFAYVDFLLGAEIYNWQGVVPKSMSKEEFLDNRFKDVCLT